MAHQKVPRKLWTGVSQAPDTPLDDSYAARPEWERTAWRSDWYLCELDPRWSAATLCTSLIISAAVSKGCARNRMPRTLPGIDRRVGRHSGGRRRAAVRHRKFGSAARRRLVALATEVSLAVLVATGCTVAAAKSTPAPTLTINPVDGSRGILPGAPIIVAAKHGKVRDVTVTTAAGPVRGYLAANGIW